MNILEVKNIHKSFGRTKVLEGVNFSMKEGEVLSILGSSGSGKTTLLRCINFLERADEGVITVNGEVVFDAKDASLTQKQIRKSQLNFGLVFQSFNLFPQYNVLENVTLAPKLLAKEREDYKTNKSAILAEIDRNAKDILSRVGLSEKLTNYPCELSGGQQQRVSIARALALKPKILFFDEPTSALDPELTGEILRVIKQLAKENITMVIVTHEINFAKNVSDRILFMDSGIVAEEGTPSDVIDNPQNERTKAFLSQLQD
ncbi:MAG: amino acid ABC transporter ATP-binding protein [Ruminococcaceae bacterium]|nr:amino acid ABC transporter ATP-binding protein [Oscillospiraceae bacterium]